MKESITRFYEAFPLPQPTEQLDDGFFNGTRAAEGCPSWMYHIFWPRKERNLDLDILIAGCGTTQASTYAAALPHARITAIDVSEHSLKHSRRLAEKYKLANIEHQLLKIEDVAALKKSFDLVISTGVLHHLESPAVGLKALKKTLKPDGSMYLMLYGTYGRAGIYILQDMFQRIGINPATATESDVREVGKIITQLPQGHPFLTGEYGSISGESLPDVADLFINPRDKSYTVPEIYDLLDSAGMELQQWIYRFHYSMDSSRLMTGAFGEKIKTLPMREQYAIGELHRGSISKHHFVCCSADRDRQTYVTDLDAADWKNLIPIKNMTMAITDKTVTDGRSQWITLPHYAFYRTKVDFTLLQTHIFNGVDGQKTIGALMDAIPSGLSAGAFDVLAKDLFKHLYDYDLVWFRKNG